MVPDPHRPHAARLARTPSISSQSSLESSASRTQGHRGSSPQIRAFGPDGRSVLEGPLIGASGGRSPSPLRAASFDARAAPPGFVPSHGSLASLASLVSETPSSPRAPRCLSPLLIPPRIDRSNSIVEGSNSIPPASPLGTLQPDLYTKREGPLFLGLPDNLSHSTSLGRLHMRLKYDFDRSDLTVHLIEAHDLAGSDQEGFTDPYVRLMLLPEVDNRARQTSIHHNDPNPFFDQHFKFPVSHDDLSEKTLLLQVYDYDRYSRNEVTGEVRVALEGLSVAGGVEVWGEISRQKRPPEELQELMLSLSYLPSAERLTVVVLKARNLLTPGHESKDTLDPFVKVYLVVSGKRVKKKKTAICKDTTEPVWNEALSFSLSSSNLQDAAIEVCVSSGNQAIGWCCVGATESDQESLHWNQMIQQPRKATAMWHTLR
ncbi:synaptotagmin beta [Arctopsyche grandis]|uniref:synaptotagmin beta n=1 Tax=Arctopsyche grandis TaxID=121162 RepID=UPI00406D6BAD